MSHHATNWAIAQRGLKPATKIVLWHLADCHNPSNGCFPSQEYLADCCEMSRSSLNEHLAALETAGLIRREQRRDQRTRRQESTRYRLAFEPDFSGNPSPETGHGSDKAVSGNQGEPCPENGDSRVQNPDTNLVREPVREPLNAPEREREGGIEDRRKIEAEGWALLKDWPGFAGMPKEPALREWMKLDEASRTMARERFPAWQALLKSQRKSHVPAPATYLRERLFDAIPAEAVKAAEGERLPVAAPYGKLWNAVRLHSLLQPNRPLPKPTGFLAKLMAEASEAGERERMAHRARWGWPMVNDLHKHAENWRGWTVPADLAWLESHASAFEQVRVGSELWQAWKDEHVRRGWPWVPDPGKHEWIYFPAGGPAGLSAFEAAISGEGRDNDGGEREAAE